MSSDIAIKVENLSKCYLIYEKPQDRLLQMLSRGRKQYYKEFWALKDVSFEVKKGETVGVVGRNGCGKSTLLQMICGTLNPVGGSIEASGRIAALLELGSGFNPEFTGRENVYMNAALLGLSHDEIDARYDDIVAFADIGDFVGQAVKTYSSGMLVRLAFAVAINVEPDILVVDEALSVGDELFQRKCYSKIEAIKKSGATILFVSHSGGTVVELCDRAILLDKGEQLAMGAPKAIVGYYQKLLYAPDDKREQILNDIKSKNVRVDVPDGCVDNRESLSKLAMPSASKVPEEFFDPHLKPQSTIVYESQGAIIDSVQILNLLGEPVNCLMRGGVYRYTYEVRFDEGISGVRFGMLIKTLSGVELGGCASSAGFEELEYYAKNSVIRVEFRFECKLNTGTYFLNAGVLGLKNSQETYLHRLIDVCMFRVLPCSEILATGIVDFNCIPSIVKLL